MHIPGVTQFGNTVPNVAPMADTSPINEAVNRLGNSLSQVGNQISEAQTEEIRRRSAEQEALAREKDGNAYLDHQLQVKQLESDYTDKIASGEIPYKDAGKMFTDDVNKIPAPASLARGRAAQENLNHGVQLNIKQALIGIQNKVDAAQKLDYQTQGLQQLDTLGKLAGLPDSNVETINQQGDNVLPLLRRGNLSEAQATKVLQDWKDKNWYNQATQKAMESRQDLGALKQLETDLTAKDGFYAGKLDTDKRNAVLNQVINHRIQLENKMVMHADRRDAAGERALAQYERQIASGVPSTPDMITDWKSTISGTSSEAEFNDLLKSEVETQEMLRKPAMDQLNFVQQKQQDLLKNGGSVQEQANVARLTNAVKQNLSLMQNFPVKFAANRTGADPEPLDFMDMMTGGDASKQELARRMNTIAGLRKQQGMDVPSRPLLPEEASQLAAIVNKNSSEHNAQLFANMRNAFDSPEGFVGAMQQIAPDAPVKAQAGALAAKDVELKTKNWFKADTSMPSEKVSETMLFGDSIINPSKEAKSADGKPKLSLYLPEEKTLQMEFANTVGTAYAVSPQMAEQDYQAVKAYYVGRMAQLGKIAGSNADVDTGVVKEAVRNVVGNVFSYNGQSKVIAPWGMDESTFRDRADVAIANLAKATDMPILYSQRSNLGLIRLDANNYQVVANNTPLKDPKTNQLLTINITAPMAVDKKPLVRGRGVVGSEDVTE